MTLNGVYELKVIRLEQGESYYGRTGRTDGQSDHRSLH